MRRININTNQNVTANYELASLSDRCLAFLLDFILLGATILILFFIFTMAGGFRSTVYQLIFLPLIFFYSLISEIIFSGQTLGKKIIKIKTNHLSGNSLTLINYTTRWAFRVVDITMSFGSIACIMILSSTKKQRLGDLISDTIVIKIKDRQDLKLSEILKIEDNSEYQIKYPSVNLLSENQVILIKKTIIRKRKYDNNSHKEAIKQLALKLKEILKIESKTNDDEQFLNDLLKDYIISTR